jgi:fatty acid CoA ligase FadD36
MGRRSGSSYPEPPVDRPALILYTGGTSGPPKGVRVSRAAIATDLDAVADAWQWTADDVLVHGLPLFGVHGLVLGVLGPLRIGGRLVHTGEPRPEAYAAAAGSLYFGVPEVWSRICADTRSARALRPARLLVSGGATLPIPVFGQLAALTGHRPVERYGTTETLITTSGCARGDRRPGYVGRALSGVQTRLVDESGSALPADDRAVGELQVRGPMLFGGYHNRPLATAESFAPGGWFRTGDLATMSPDGWHRIVGRSATDLIVCDGYRIGAGEVEIALRSHPAVRDATVLGTPHPRLGQQVTAYVVADGVTAQELVDFVARVLPAHKRPRRVHLAETLPGTTLGRWRSAC